MLGAENDHHVNNDHTYAAAVNHISNNDSLFLNGCVRNFVDFNHRQTAVWRTEANIRKIPAMMDWMTKEIECHIL